MMIKSMLIGLALFLLQGCVSSNTQEVTAEVFSRTSVGHIKARTLNPGDEIEFSVEVSGVQEVPLSVAKLDYSGSVTVPLIGSVKLGSLTLAQARSALEKGYGKIFVAAPLITLRLAGEVVGEWGYVTVLGLVRSPGRIPIDSLAGINLSDALHAAGGFDQSANMQSIVVTRKTVDGELIQCKCDITKLGLTGSEQYDLTLFNGDVVYVPERLF